MKNILILGLLSLGVLSVGCGQSGNSSNPPPPQVVLDQNGNPLPSVDGTWSSRCQRDYSFVGGKKRGNDGDLSYQRATYVIHGDQVTYDVQKFSDAQCNTPGTDVSRFVGHYQSQKAINGEAGARQVNLKFDTCAGDCSAYGAITSNLYDNQTRVFKVDKGQLYVGTQATGGSIQWDFGEGFYSNGN